MTGLEEKGNDSVLTDLNNSADDLAALQQNPRQHFITTAVKFLLNPRVRRTNLHQKQAFLRQKGLTPEEIELACVKAGAFAEEQKNNAELVPVRNGPYAHYDPKLTFWMKARDAANLIALFSIGSYSIYSFWKRYISPRIFGTRTSQELQYQQLLNSIIQLNENVAELKTLIRTLKSTSLSAPPVSRARDNSIELQDLRQELSSIKGLLLSRNQFPSSPGIPSWQMLETELVVEADKDSGGRRRKDRKGAQRRTEDEDPVVPLELGAVSVPPQASGGRKQSSSVDLDSNNGFNSGSSCEVVFMGGKNDSNSDPDHSDE